jgi:hypothetical protein
MALKMKSATMPWIWVALAIGCFRRQNHFDALMATAPPPVELYSSPITVSNGVAVQCGLFDGGPNTDSYLVITGERAGLWALTTLTNTRSEPIWVASAIWDYMWITRQGLIVRPEPPEGQVSGPRDQHFAVGWALVNPGDSHASWTKLRRPSGTPGSSALGEIWNVRAPGLVEQPLVCVGQWRASTPELGEYAVGHEAWQEVASDPIPVCILFNADVGWAMYSCGRTLGDR